MKYVDYIAGAEVMPAVSPLPPVRAARAELKVIEWESRSLSYRMALTLTSALFAALAAYLKTTDPSEAKRSPKAAAEFKQTLPLEIHR